MFHKPQVQLYKRPFTRLYLSIKFVKSVDFLELELNVWPSLPGVQDEQTVEFKINRTDNRLKCSVEMSCLLITLDRLSLLLSLSHSKSFKFFHFGVLRVN